MMQSVGRGRPPLGRTMFPTNAYAADAEMSLADVRGLLLLAPALPTTPDPLGAWKRAVGGVSTDSPSGSRAARRCGSPPRAPTSDSGSPGGSSSPADGKHNMPDGEFFTGADRGLGGRRGRLSPAGDGRRPRGCRRAAPLRVREGGRCHGRARRGVSDQPARHRRGRPTPRRARDRHQLRRSIAEPGTSCWTRRSAARSTWRSGRATPSRGGSNQSAVHTDMVCDLRRGGRIEVDGELLQEDGRFVV